MPVYRLGNKAPRLADDCWIAPDADVIGDVTLRTEASVWFRAVIRGDNDPITIGARSNVQDGAVLHSDEGVPLTIGDDVTIGHQAMVHSCVVGDGSLIGIGAVILARSVIGAGSIVGAGALVPEGKVYPDGVLLVGTPARIVRELTDEERARLLGSAAHYVRNARRFREDLSLA